MKKDKQVTIRINSEILEAIKKSGMSVQKIVDEYTTKNYETVFSIKRKKK